MPTDKGKQFLHLFGMRKIAISALITPLLKDQSLDREGLANLLERNIRHGFDGVFGLEVKNVWNGQKYALMKLGLIASPLTFAQEMTSLDDSARSRIDRCLDECREILD